MTSGIKRDPNIHSELYRQKLREKAEDTIKKSRDICREADQTNEITLIAKGILKGGILWGQTRPFTDYAANLYRDHSVNKLSKTEKASHGIQQDPDCKPTAEFQDNFEKNPDRERTSEIEQPPLEAKIAEELDGNNSHVAGTASKVGEVFNKEILETKGSPIDICSLNIDNLKNEIKMVLMEARRSAKLDKDGKKIHLYEIAEFVREGFLDPKSIKKMDKPHSQVVALATQKMESFIHDLAPEIDAEQVVKEVFMEAGLIKRSTSCINGAAVTTVTELCKRSRRFIPDEKTLRDVNTYNIIHMHRRIPYNFQIGEHNGCGERYKEPNPLSSFAMRENNEYKENGLGFSEKSWENLENSKSFKPDIGNPTTLRDCGYSLLDVAESGLGKRVDQFLDVSSKCPEIVAVANKFNEAANKFNEACGSFIDGIGKCARGVADGIETGLQAFGEELQKEQP